ncbi:MAG: (2Fe-2S)-binding protein [Deltaproteobacteria bacterium]|nr:(2Fe-2S)-binding protein [Deltaproteobacteria bacterium]
MPTITFMPSGVTIEVKPGTTVFNAAARAEVPIASQCGGKCACALCRVKVVGGAELISPMTWEEEGHMGNAFYITRQRLSCQLQVFGDVTIEVAEIEERSKPKGRYVPHALLRKREALEREADLQSSTRGGKGASKGAMKGSKKGASEVSSPDGSKGSPKDASRSKYHRPTPPVKRKPKRRRRNPGAPRSGDSRAPAGAKKKDP